MNRPDHSTYREWLNLDADGLLAGEERTLLNEHLASCAECRSEREELAALEGLLRRSAVAVRPDFKETVMASLQPAGWEARSPRTWRFPAAVFVLLGGLAAALMVAGSAAEPAGVSALLAVGSLFQAALLAGAGLLAASWKGVGLVFQEVISSPVSLGAFGFLVLCLNLLLVSLIRRRRPAGAAAHGKGVEK
jgi:predicted anti-sigma-YlaC factor YlaD